METQERRRRGRIEEEVESKNQIWKVRGTELRKRREEEAGRKTDRNQKKKKREMCVPEFSKLRR